MIYFLVFRKKTYCRIYPDACAGNIMMMGFEQDSDTGKCCFSPGHYADILKAMAGRAGTVSERKEIILTHDIDVFPPYALQLARMEHRHGVRATYFVLLHSEWYNALSPENMEIWKKIGELGHEIALHYDGRYDGDMAAVHKAFCAMLKTNSINVSQHLVGITPDIEVPDGLYDRSRLKGDGYHYIADSGGWWRNGCVCQHLDKKVYFVSHPVWWIAGAFDVVEHDANQVTRRARRFWEEMVSEHRKQKVQVAARSA
ncbi:hypothetical protein [Nitrososphaera sp.]|uniref:hypothetical protein n=1 Tax=Nitrososphaera sp. TaxID=1971748 RepID=UPI001839256B|nr:hypothetical protein [Nitrososphaera sp.]NWG36190.1 hypothetical protein [Nitrososphaera sp.]